MLNAGDVMELRKFYLE